MFVVKSLRPACLVVALVAGVAGVGAMASPVHAQPGCQQFAQKKVGQKYQRTLGKRKPALGGKVLLNPQPLPPKLYKSQLKYVR